MPLCQLAFHDAGQAPSALSIIEIFIDVFFALDLAVNFRTGFIDPAGSATEVVTEPRRIAKHYLLGWFTFDLISSLPFELIFRTYLGSGGGGASAQASNAKLLKVGRTLKALKAVRFNKLLKMGRRGSSTASLLAGVIKSNTVLRLLDLRGTSISEEAARELAVVKPPRKSISLPQVSDRFCIQNLDESLKVQDPAPSPPSIKTPA